MLKTKAKTKAEHSTCQYFYHFTIIPRLASMHNSSLFVQVHYMHTHTFACTHTRTHTHKFTGYTNTRFLSYSLHDLDYPYCVILGNLFYYPLNIFCPIGKPMDYVQAKPCFQSLYYASLKQVKILYDRFCTIPVAFNGRYKALACCYGRVSS